VAARITQNCNQEKVVDPPTLRFARARAREIHGTLAPSSAWKSDVPSNFLRRVPPRARGRARRCHLREVNPGMLACIRKLRELCVQRT